MALIYRSVLNYMEHWAMNISAETNYMSSDRRLFCSEALRLLDGGIISRCSGERWEA